MGVDGAGEVLGAATVFHVRYHFADQFAGVVAENLCTENFVGLRVRDNFDVAVRDVGRDCPPVRGEVKLADVDRDGDLDILFGDFFTAKLLIFHNDGTPANAAFSMSRLDTAFRPNGDDVESIGFNQPVSGDIDRDGDIDVLISSLFPLAVEQPVLLYENVAEGPNAPMTMRKRSLDVTSEIDFGTFAAPTPINDATHHGILVGSSDGRIAYLSINTTGGTTTMRAEALYATLPNLFQAVPAAGDLDGDGIAEVLVGDANDGRVRLFRFQGNVLAAVAWQLDTFHVNQYAAPALVDADRDGDLDVFVAAGNGQFVFFQNIGSPTQPLFARETPPAPFAGLDVGSNAALTFGDLNADGLPDAIVGSRVRSDALTGTARFYLNNGSGWAASPAFSDLATDRSPVPALVLVPEGRFLIVGTSAGGLLAYQDSALSSSGITVADAAGRLRLEHDGMASANSGGIVRIAGNIPGGAASLRLIDLLGRATEIGTLADNLALRTIRLPAVTPGMYLLTAGTAYLGRIVIVP